ncbi:hypothetical protein [Symbiopectobacterium sp. RP]|uniref:hypothetical protein n=1 Tax=Symbiopectobacterium sp. RP TaxID=3248553 RepID=UPI003D2987D8
MNAEANNAKGGGNRVTFRVPVTHDGNKWLVLNYALPTMVSDRQKNPVTRAFSGIAAPLHAAEHQ